MGRANGVTFVEVIGTEVLVRGAPLQYVVTGSEDGTGDGDQRSLGASQCSQPPELGLQVSPFGFGCGPSSFTQGSTQPGIASARGTALSFPTGLVVARTDPCPTHYVSREGKASTVGPTSATKVQARRCLMPGTVTHRSTAL